jgi:hypothetical protein
MHSNADPDPSFHLNADSDGTFHYNADPDPDTAPYQDLQTLDGSILILHVSNLSAQAPTWLNFEPLNLLNFDFFADPASQNKADHNPHPQPWSLLYSTIAMIIDKTFYVCTH